MNDDPINFYPDCASCDIPDSTDLTDITCNSCINGYFFND